MRQKRVVCPELNVKVYAGFQGLERFQGFRLLGFRLWGFQGLGYRAGLWFLRSKVFSIQGALGFSVFSVYF